MIDFGITPIPEGRRETKKRDNEGETTREREREREGGRKGGKVRKEKWDGGKRGSGEEKEGRQKYSLKRIWGRVCFECFESAEESTGLG